MRVEFVSLGWSHRLAVLSIYTNRSTVMAWLQTDPSGNYHISFRFGGQKFKRSLKTKSERDANGRLLRLEENIRLVVARRWTITFANGH